MKREKFSLALSTKIFSVGVPQPRQLPLTVGKGKNVTIWAGLQKLLGSKIKHRNEKPQPVGDEINLGLITCDKFEKQIGGHGPTLMSLITWFVF